MLDLASMIMADKSNRHHVLSARPNAPIVSEPQPRWRGDATRRLVVAALRRLADRLERRCVNTITPVP